MDTENQLSRKQKQEMFVAGILLLLGIGVGLFNLGYPYNCSQAKSVVKEAESEFEAARFNAGNPAIYSSDVTLEYSHLSLLKARAKHTEKCFAMTH